MSRSCTRNAPTHRATRRSGDCSACRKRRRSRRSASSSSSRSWWTSASFGPIPTARSFPRRLWTRSSSSRGARIRRTRRATTTAIMISTSAGKRSRATRPNWPTISMSSSTASRIASSTWRSSRGCWSGSRRGSSAARESITASDYTADEMMAAVAARELADGEVVFVGIGLPNLACNLARRTHAPNLVLIYESGAVGATPSRLPVSIGDPALVTGSLMVCGMADVFQLFLQNGRIEVGFLGGAQVDRHGNINTTVIGPYKKPKVRLPGSGGAAEIAIHAHRILIVSKLSPRGFPERVDFLTSPGQRVAKVITDKAVLERDKASGDLVLAGLYPGVEVAEVRAGVGWALQSRARLVRLDPPTAAELQLLREVLDPQRLYLKS